MRGRWRARGGGGGGGAAFELLRRRRVSARGGGPRGRAARRGPVPTVRGQRALGDARWGSGADGGGFGRRRGHLAVAEGADARGARERGERGGRGAVERQQLVFVRSEPARRAATPAQRRAPLPPAPPGAARGAGRGGGNCSSAPRASPPPTPAAWMSCLMSPHARASGFGPRVPRGGRRGGRARGAGVGWA